jgi:hypothetical protein
MRKIIFLVVGIFIASNVKAQDTLNIKAGVLVAPIGGLDLKNLKEGFKVFVPVTLLFSFTKGSNTVTPQYNMSANAFGIRFAHDCNPKFTAYAIFLKNVKDKDGYVGIGAETSALNGIGFLFTELGTGLKSLTPVLYTGVFISFKIKIKKLNKT